MSCKCKEEAMCVIELVLFIIVLNDRINSGGT